MPLERPRQEGREGGHPPGAVALGASALSLTQPLSSGHPAEAERQVPEQGVEEEVRDAL